MPSLRWRYNQLLSKLTPYARSTNSCFLNQLPTLVAHPCTRGTTLRRRYKQLLSKSIPTLVVYIPTLQVLTPLTLTPTNWFCGSLVFLVFCKKLCHSTSLPIPDMKHWIWSPIRWTWSPNFNWIWSPIFNFENNFKQAINCPVTRANINKRSQQRTNWRYHCFLMYVTQQWRSYHVNFSFTVT